MTPYFVLLVAIAFSAMLLSFLILSEVDELRDRLKRIEGILTADKQPNVSNPDHEATSKKETHAPHSSSSSKP